RWAAMASPRSSRGACRRNRRRRWPRSPEISERQVAHDWSELFIVGEPGYTKVPQNENPSAEREAGAAEPGSREGGPSSRAPKRGGLLRRLRESMAKTRQALGSEIQATLFGVLAEQTWARLEEALIMADVGARTTASVVARLEAEASGGELEGGEGVRQRVGRRGGVQSRTWAGRGGRRIALLAPTPRIGARRIDIRSKPTVIMAVGVNGTGKTTTIGKL